MHKLQWLTPPVPGTTEFLKQSGSYGWVVLLDENTDFLLDRSVKAEGKVNMTGFYLWWKKSPWTLRVQYSWVLQCPGDHYLTLFLLPIHPRIKEVKSSGPTNIRDPYPDLEEAIILSRKEAMISTLLVFSEEQYWPQKASLSASMCSVESEDVCPTLLLSYF